MYLKKQIIIISAFSGIIALVLIFVFIFPLLKGLRENSLNLINIKKELALFENETGGIENLRTTCKKIESDLEKIENLFVNAEVPVDLIKFWEKTALNSEISIKISPISLDNENNKEGSWNSMIFRLTLIGSFSDFLRFLEKIETGDYLTEIEDLSINKLTGSELKFEEYENFSINHVKSLLTVKVFTK